MQFSGTDDLPKTTFTEKLKNFTKELSIRAKLSLIDFCHTTTLQGLRHTVANNYHPIERFFWTIMFMVMSYSAVTLCVQQLNRFNTRPTVVSIRKDFRNWTITYPAVTICVVDKVDEKLVENFVLGTWNVSTEDEDKYEYYSGFVNLVATLSFRTNLRLFWRFEHDNTLSNLNLMEVVLSVYRQVTIRTTTHDPKHKNLWTPIMTEMGLCRTFNSVFSRYQSIQTWMLQKTKPHSFSHEVNEKDLLSCNYMSKQCYARFTAVNHTAIYYVHSPWEIADSITTNTGYIEEGQEVEAVYRVSEMRTDPDVIKLRHSQRRCKYPQETTSKAIPAYSNGLCQIECRTRMAVVFCGCRPYFIIFGNAEPCDVNGMACLGRSMEILVNLPINLAKCQCVPQCTEINYIPHDKRPNTWNSTDDSLFDRRASLRLALQMPKIIMHKNVIFTFEDLIGSFGGVCALFLGMSFMSFVEIIICLLKPFMQSLYKR